MEYRNECQQLLDHVIREHDDITRKLARIQDEFEVDDPKDLDVVRAPVRKGMGDLRRLLTRHFRKEEEGGFLEEAIARCPRVAGAVVQVESEHSQLLVRIDHVIEGLDQGEPMTRVRAAFDRLHHELRKHECKENAILAEAFNKNVEDLDLPRN